MLGTQELDKMFEFVDSFGFGNDLDEEGFGLELRTNNNDQLVPEKKRTGRHKITEQKGRQKINDQINELKTLLPECRYVATTKASVLECAVNSLKRLQTLNNQLVMINKKIEHENKLLQRELEKYLPNFSISLVKDDHQEYTNTNANGNTLSHSHSHSHSHSSTTISNNAIINDNSNESGSNSSNEDDTKSDANPNANTSRSRRANGVTTSTTQSQILYPGYVNELIQAEEFTSNFNLSFIGGSGGVEGSISSIHRESSYTLNDDLLSSSSSISAPMSASTSVIPSSPTSSISSSSSSPDNSLNNYMNTTVNDSAITLKQAGSGSGSGLTGVVSNMPINNINHNIGSLPQQQYLNATNLNYNNMVNMGLLGYNNNASIQQQFQQVQQLQFQQHQRQQQMVGVNNSFNYQAQNVYHLHNSNNNQGTQSNYEEHTQQGEDGYYRVTKRKLFMLCLLMIPIFLSFDSSGGSAPFRTHEMHGRSRVLLNYSMSTTGDIVAAIYYFDVARFMLYFILGIFGIKWTANSLVWLSNLQSHLPNYKV